MTIDPSRHWSRLPKDREELLSLFLGVREQTESLCSPLKNEDFQLQSMPDCSPPKWHLAHTTWFFETFVLRDREKSFQPHHPLYHFLFNSYYEAEGPRWPRAQRGQLSRPTVHEVFDYREAVNQRVKRLLENLGTDGLEGLLPVIELGLHHEQQHQELLLTDLKHAFALNPLCPVYSPNHPANNTNDISTKSARWIEHPGGLVLIGHDGQGFAFDNESPRHQQFLSPFRIAHKPVTCGEFMAFMRSGGYDRAELWLSDGWACRKAQQWDSPLYWQNRDGGWWQYTLEGLRPVAPNEPVAHLSFYEADAFARWAECRLPTEAEWETACGAAMPASRRQGLHPTHQTGEPGQVWEWTSSPYTAYPGYRPAAGALGEYNGKFMCNQMVLRGASCVTPSHPMQHSRASYRNFFPPDARWQFTGLRLAKDHLP